MRKPAFLRSLMMFTAVLILCVPLAGNATTAPLLTTSMVPFAASQITQEGIVGVIITYNNTLDTPTSVGIYLSVANSAGQTVFLTFSSVSSVSPGESFEYFVALSHSGLANGNYTASFFASNAHDVVLSTVTSINVSL